MCMCGTTMCIYCKMPTAYNIMCIPAYWRFFSHPSWHHCTCKTRGHSQLTPAAAKCPATRLGLRYKNTIPTITEHHTMELSILSVATGEDFEKACTSTRQCYPYSPELAS